MKRRAWCIKHQRECFLQTSMSHTAGSSCTAHSKQGKQLAFADRNAIHFLAWAGMRLEVQEAEITLENVAEFPTSVLERLLGPAYFIEAHVMDPRTFGFFGRNFMILFCLLSWPVDHIFATFFYRRTWAVLPEVTTQTFKITSVAIDFKTFCAASGSPQQEPESTTD